MEILVRQATLNDLDTLLTFEQGVIAAERPYDITLKQDPTRYYDIEKMIAADDVEILVAELNDKVIGCGYARIEKSKPFLQHTHHAYLGFMYVEPEHRGKGINKMIIDELTVWATAQNINELRLEVYVENEAAIKAYERAGFVRHMVEMRKDTGC